MGQALPKPGLRPFLPADVPMLAAIFVASIEELTGDDYSEAQQEAWAAAVEDEEAFGQKLAGQLTLIATIQSAPVGFASLRGADHIDMLYVHPSAARQGVASMLVEAGSTIVTPASMCRSLIRSRSTAAACASSARLLIPSGATGSGHRYAAAIPPPPTMLSIASVR